MRRSWATSISGGVASWSTGISPADERTRCSLRPSQAGAGEDYADRARTSPTCRGTEERVDRRTMQVFLWTMHQLDVSLVNQQMLIRRCDIDLAEHDSFVINSMYHRQAGLAREYAGQQTRGVCRNVQHNEHRSLQIVRQLLDQS